MAREGAPYIVGAALAAVAVFALALNRRSWPLWLLAVALVVAALGVALHFRAPQRAPEVAIR